MILKFQIYMYMKLKFEDMLLLNIISNQKLIMN